MYTALYTYHSTGHWTAEIVDLPECHTYGATIDQCRDRIREALGLFDDDADTADIRDAIQIAWFQP